MRCLDTMIITEILRLKVMHFTLRAIGNAAGCSKTTAGEILSRCKECGLTYNDAFSMTAERVNELIYPESFGRKQVKEEPDWESIHKRLAGMAAFQGSLSRIIPCWKKRWQMHEEMRKF